MIKSKKKKSTSRHEADEDDVESRIRKVSDVDKSRSYVLYGRSGTGKTTLACTFPKPILILNVRDDGTDSVADEKDVFVMDINSFEEFEDAYWYLHQHPKKYKTVVIDTVSQLQQLVVKETAQDKKKDVSRAGDWGTLSQRDWGDIAALMKEWLTNYRDLAKKGMDIVFIAQDRTFNTNDDGDDADDALTPEVGPALSPSIAKALNAMVSVIGNTFIRVREKTKEVNGKKKEKTVMQFCLRIGPNPIFVTKVRKPRDIEAPAFIIDPSYRDIMEVIKGE